MKNTVNNNKDFIRVLLSESCNAKCDNCFNRKYRRKKEMDITIYYKLCSYLKNNGIKRLKIMGGEPTVHENFEEAVKIAKKNFNSVSIFTNALNNKIKNIIPRKHDSIIYNFDFIDKNFDTRKLLLDKPGNRSVEIQVSSNSDIENIEERILNLYRDIQSNDKVGINLTLNCVEDIFANKKIIIKKWNRLNDFIVNVLKIEYDIDHNIPECFLEGNKMKLLKPSEMCSEKCAGLIDSSFMLRYCNQYPVNLISIIRGNSFVSFKVIQNYLTIGKMKKLLKNLTKICANCRKFNRSCNGGCFIHKDFVLEGLKDKLTR